VGRPRCQLHIGGGSLSARDKTVGASAQPQFEMHCLAPCADRRFVAALEQSGGVVQATPRAVLNALGMEGVSYAQVKSHLQRHRNAHIADMMDRGEDVSHLSEAQLR
jgi:SHAQKYF class myb-like DNA-binding protein